MSRPTRFYLVRHGETDWNVERRYQGQYDTDLNANGQAQAQAIAPKLAALPETFAAIYASPLRRTMQTAAPIAQALGLSVQPEPALMEINCGALEGLNRDEINAAYPDFLPGWRASVMTQRMPGGESIGDVLARVGPAYEALLRRHPGEGLILVAHGGTLLSLMAHIMRWDVDHIWHQPDYRLGNTTLTQVHVDPISGDGQIIHYNYALP